MIGMQEPDSRAWAVLVPSVWRSTVVWRRLQTADPECPSFETILLEHCEMILASGRCRGLVVQLELRCEGVCPATHERSVLRVADELLSNAMEHGFHCRRRGRVFVHVVSRAGHLQVSVSDDG
jgi:signal transduction histidine kinase